MPDSFRADLFPLDLERIENEYLSFIKRIPSSETLGIKDDFNGPICYTPDGNPLLGPAFGLRNLWLAEGFSFGITAAGGAGYYLAQMMINGEAEIDMTSLDPKRYGSWITTEYTSRKMRSVMNMFTFFTTPMKKDQLVDHLGPSHVMKSSKIMEHNLVR